MRDGVCGSGQELVSGLAGAQSSRVGQVFQEQGSPDFMVCDKMRASSPEPQLLWLLRGDAERVCVAVTGGGGSPRGTFLPMHHPLTPSPVSVVTRGFASLPAPHPRPTLG